MECHRMTEPIFVYRNADISLYEKPPMLCLLFYSLINVLRHVSATLVSKGMSQSLITARKRSCGKVMFYTCLSFCSQGVVWLWVCASRSGCVCHHGYPLDTTPGTSLDTHLLDTHRPGHTHHLDTHTRGHTRTEHTSLTVNKRVVRILLECFQTAIFFAL